MGSLIYNSCEGGGYDYALDVRGELLDRPQDTSGADDGGVQDIFDRVIEIMIKR